MRRLFASLATFLVLLGGLPSALAASWNFYSSPRNNYFVDIEYPSGFFIGDYTVNGYPILEMTTSPGVMTLPGESSCMETFDDCHDVASGMRVLAMAVEHDRGFEMLDGFQANNLEVTPYHNVRKVKDLSRITSLLEPVNLKTAYLYSGAIGASYRIDVYEKDFQGDMNLVVERFLTSLENNKRFGFIESANQSFLSVDLAKFFPYWEAKKAAMEDGACDLIVDGECQLFGPGGYIRNLDGLLTELPLSADVEVLMTTYDSQQAGIPHQISLEAFLDIFNGNDPAHAHLQENGYFLELRDGEIVKILEMFTP